MSHSSPFPQPEHLTKERLKQELKRHGVPFEPYENKDYYVRLYRSKVARWAARRQRGEFSSDEELVRRSPRFGGRKHQSKSASPQSYMSLVTRLSDEELSEELHSYGEEGGPITDTTRGVYQRKLAKLMFDKAKAASRSRDEPDSAGDQEEEEEEEGEGEGEGQGEWSTQSSEGESGGEEEKEEGEEEEEAGVRMEGPSVKLRSRVPTAAPIASKPSHSTHRMAYVSYSTPSRHVESSYMLKKPREDKTRSKGPQLKGKSVPTPQQIPASRSRKQKPHPPATPPSFQRVPIKATPPSATPSTWNFIASFVVLVIMFVVTFLIYDHMTSEDSYFTRSVGYLTQMGLVWQEKQD